MALHLSTLHVKKNDRIESNKSLTESIFKTKSVPKTTLTNNSNLNKAHDTQIRTTNKQQHHQGQKN